MKPSRPADLPPEAAIRSKAAALLDPAVAAALMGETPAFYVADSRGRILLSSPALDKLHRDATDRMPAVTLARSPLIGDAIARLRRGEDDVTLTHDAGGGTVSTHRRVRAGSGRTLFVGRYHPSGEATQAKQDFLRRVSHDLLTPLNAIIGFAEMPLHDETGRLTERHCEYFQAIRDAAAGLLGRIETILAFVEDDGAAASAVLGPVVMEDLIDAAADSALSAAAVKGVIVEIAHSARQVSALADPDHVRRIIDNLMRNAVTHTEPGGHIVVEGRDAGGGLVDIVVRDTGAGIPAAEHARVFESFQQLPPDPYLASHGGAGLGLTVSRRLARAMNGDLLLESEAGKGASFALRLPSV